MMPDMVDGMASHELRVNHRWKPSAYKMVLKLESEKLIAISGFVAPKAVALMTDSNVHSSKLWREVFFLFAGVAFFGGITFTLFASGEVQDWAREDLKLDFYETLQNENDSDENDSEDELNDV